ncbi:hypothetical protein FPZ12_024615 [Amycolatopsis acidicola]|uniref:Zinc-binding dehydrogenase n=1 Tax=Amycolatopsis acidicola TaxID=2596893 RepID=A0A5N0UWM2_9PSEU|nr:hypothetical protein FPZ12_024615 [Amycolatopsis acidicola]
MPAIPGFDGVGALPDGTVVGFGNVRPPYGALAERAVQVLRKLGAGRVIATGRRAEALREVGADATIRTDVPDEDLVAAFRHVDCDVVLDFLWGRPTELLIRALTPAGLGLAKPTRLVQVGASAGGTLSLPAASVRTSGVEIYGATKGLTPTAMTEAYEQVVEWARAGELVCDIERVPLSGIEDAWARDAPPGKRMVVVPG